MIASVRQFADFFLQQKNGVFALPASFVSLKATSNTTTTGSGSNAGLAAISASLDPVIAERLFNQGAQNAAYQAFTSVLKPGTIDATLVATANVLASASVPNAANLLELLRSSLKGQDNSSGGEEANVDAALSLGLVRNILDFTSRSVLSQALQDFVSPLERQNPAFELVQKALSSTIDLSSIGVALGC